MAVTGRYLFTQPETLLAVIGCVIIYFATHAGTSLTDVGLKFLHLLSFGILTGISFWVTFIAGLTKFRILPRPWFSKVQSALFPKYMKYSFVFSGLALFSFYMIIKDSHRDDLFYKLGGLVIATICNLLGCFILVPFLSSLDTRNSIEARENVGKGIGNDNEDCKKLKETSSEYAAAYNSVVFYHAVSAFVNLISLLGTVTHLCVLSYSISIN